MTHNVQVAFSIPIQAHSRRFDSIDSFIMCDMHMPMISIPLSLSLSPPAGYRVDKLAKVENDVLRFNDSHKKFYIQLIDPLNTSGQ